MKTLIAITLTAAILAGCAASGTQVSQKAALQFEEGKTTEAQIIGVLGRPTSVTVTNGMRLITYSGAQYQTNAATFVPIVGLFAGGSNYAVSVAAYQIGMDGVLQKITYSEYGGATRMGMTPAEMNPAEPTAVK